MIKSKSELQEYLLADKKVLGKSYKHPHFFSDEIWKFEICLRKHEYYLNTGNKIMSLLYHFRHHELGLKLGFTIPCNVFDKGLCIHHWGYVVVNEKAKVGSNCQIFQGVNIGENPGGGLLE